MRRLVPLVFLLLPACGDDAVPDPEVARRIDALLAGKPDGRLVAGLGPENAAAVPRLLEAFRSDERRFVRATIATALGNIGALDAAPALADACAAPDATVRVAAALAHWKITRRYEPGLAALVAAAQEPRAGALALNALAEAPDVPPRAVAPFVDAARPASATRAEALRTLAAFGPAARAALPHIETAVDDDDPRVRMQAAWALHRVAGASERAAALLLGWMNETEGLGRRELFGLVLAIGEDAPESCLAAVRPWLDDDGIDEAMRCVAIHVCGELDARDRIPRLRTLARDDPSEAVRTGAQRALEKLAKQ